MKLLLSGLNGLCWAVFILLILLSIWHGVSIQIGIPGKGFDLLLHLNPFKRHFQ